MGVVFEAIDPELDRRVAIKLLRADADGSGTNATSDARARLVREAQALARLSHPNVVGIFDVGTHDDHVWIAMELVVGRTLRRWLEEGAHGWREVLEVMEAAGRGLAAAHAAGLVHRDIKPDNVMLGDDGRVRVMDFGLARGGATADGVASAALSVGAGSGSGAMLATDVTFAGALIGTPAYMAPEQFRGEIAGPEADIFAFSVMLWEGLHGERPFAGDTLDELRANVEEGRLRGRPRGARSPRWIDAALLRGMAPTGAQRWASMDALLAALARGRRRARTRGWVAAAVTLGLTAGGLTAHERYVEAQAEAACEARGASVDALWNEASAAELRASLLATDVAFAETTADRLLPVLDAQASALRQARTEVCLDAEVRGLWDAELRRRAEWCLDERGMELGALVAELSRADPVAVQRAVEAAATLEAVAPCRDRHRLEILPAPPQDRGESEAVRRQLSRAAALRQAGRYEASLAAARETLAPAEALGWPPLIAATQRQLGASLRDTGSYAEAEAALEAAYFEAAASFALEEAVDAAVGLSFVVGIRRARHDEGVRWSRLAEVALALLGDGEESLRRGAQLSALGLVRADAAAYEEGRALLERSLAIHERILGPEHLMVANVLNDLGIVRYMVDAYEESAALQRRALAIREAALGPDHPQVAQSLCNLANVRSDMGADDEALALLERALTITERALGPDHPRVSEPLGVMADILLHAGEFARAKELAARTLAIDERALGPEHPDVALSLDVLASVHREAAEYTEAKALFERALTINEGAFGPKHPTVAESLLNLAIVEDGLDASAEAEALAERALAIQESTLGPEHSDLARALNLIGELRLAREAPATARPIFERLLTLQERHQGPEHPAVAQALLNLAYVALDERRPADAVALAERALRIADTAGETATELRGPLRFALAEALWDAPADGLRDRARARSLAAEALVHLRAADGDHEAIAEVEAFLARR
ncbi:MAG: serine/threonine protein kinase [Myxococcales bacterium]|nr:serine/threonine protein kinase [Myxococcales bacterium]